ncbi:DinB family protein [Fulvivirga imtechensis]|uniref:DinB family protein n=1 Tax=Fulvivirga imtechensis TaxID=881893 RepID=UPI00058D97F7|nr:DinB family protein [Fulvivirga imtechensis]
MRTILNIAFGLLLIGCSQENKHPTVKSILLEQLKSTHTHKDWYVPVKDAVEGLTVDQANWKDSTSNHSIGELVSHLAFWNERILIAFHGNSPPDFDGNNELTFKTFNREDWNYAVQKLDSIQTAWEQAVDNATDKQLAEWSASIANICTHNSYHTGQIVYIRKKNGWWDGSKGVK